MSVYVVATKRQVSNNHGGWLTDVDDIHTTGIEDAIAEFRARVATVEAEVPAGGPSPRVTIEVVR